VKPELIKSIAQTAQQKGAPLRITLTNGQTVVIPHLEMLWITTELLGVAHSSNPASGLPSHPTFIDPKEVAQVEILKRRGKGASTNVSGGNPDKTD
jgi:hypothetical protein